MKKNLRIVSAAAAALLAVAPVAATGVVAPSATVNAADSIAPTTTVETTEGNVWLYKKNGENNFTAVKLGDKNLSLAKGTKLTVTGAAENWNSLPMYPVSYNGETYYVSSKQIAKPAAASTTTDTASDKINAGSSSIFADTANTVVSVNAVAKTAAAPSAVNGNIVVTLDGKSYTAMLHNDANGINTKIYTYPKGTAVSASNLTAGHYWAVFNKVSLNLGNSYANKKVTLTLNRGGFQYNTATGKASSQTKTFTADANGVVDLGTVAVDFYALNSNDLQGVHFYSVKTGDVVTSGNVTLHAVNGKLSVQSVFAALTKEYQASQLTNGQGVDTLVPVNDIKAQLEKANIKVDDNGYFTAPASFNINMNAKSNNNGATASLPVTVNVDNVTPTAANETTTTKTIMHIATIYDKNGNATSEPVLRAYNSVSVVSTPVELKDASGKSKGMYYKLAGKDQYIKVGNIDGTSRTLKHNAYVYKSNGKRNKSIKTLKKGSTKTTYGKSFMINGSQMYRVGKNQYVKVANFR